MPKFIQCTGIGEEDFLLNIDSVQGFQRIPDENAPTKTVVYLSGRELRLKDNVDDLLSRAGLANKDFNPVVK